MSDEGKTTEDTLTEEMRDLTLDYCRKTCEALGRCCNEAYCDMAISAAAKHGLRLVKNTKGLLLDGYGTCIAHPKHRLLCTFHQCDISSLGYFQDDDEQGTLTEAYFRLRERIGEVHHTRGVCPTKGVDA